MNVLLIGYSSLGRRRVLPALLGMDVVRRVSIASRREVGADALDASHPRSGRVIRGYQHALDVERPDVVYVSLPNSLHREWCLAALAAGAHVIVDKPAFLNAVEAREVAEVARHVGRCCAEASVWQYHPMLDLIRVEAESEGRAPLAASATFSSPPLDPGNFRLVPDMGGGIVYDRASYAITCGRVVFGDEPLQARCVVTERHPETGVDLSCRIGLGYPRGGTLDCFFSLKGDYRNALSVLGERYGLDFERVFTPPDDYEGPVVVRRGGAATATPVPKASTFATFFERVFAAIADGTHGQFTARMLGDMEIMDRIRASSMEQSA